MVPFIVPPNILENYPCRDMVVRELSAVIALYELTACSASYPLIPFHLLADNRWMFGHSLPPLAALTEAALFIPGRQSLGHSSPFSLSQFEAASPPPSVDQPSIPYINFAILVHISTPLLLVGKANLESSESCY